MRLRTLPFSAVEQDVTQRPAAFIVGVPRSGTTLLRMMLDSHPEMAIPPESHFYFELLKRVNASALSRDDFVAFLTSFFSWGDFGIEEADLRSSLAPIEPFTISEGLR